MSNLNTSEGKRLAAVRAMRAKARDEKHARQAKRKAEPTVHGRPPRLTVRRIDDVEFDPSYQRDMPDKDARYRKMLLAWNWDAYAPILVSRRPDGSMWCYDGQTRLRAARTHGFVKLPMQVLEIDPDDNFHAREAAAFLAVNVDRKPVNTMDQVRAKETLGDAATVSATKRLAKYGYRFPHQPASNGKAVTAIKGVEMLEENGYLENYLVLCERMGFPPELMRHQPMVGAIKFFKAWERGHGKMLTPGDVLKMLKRRTWRSLDKAYESLSKMEGRKSHSNISFAFALAQVVGDDIVKAELAVE